MKKKLLSVLLVGAMMTTMLTGCGGGSDTPAAPAADSGSEAAAPAADSGSSEEAAPAAAEGEETLTVWCWDPAFNMNAMYEAEKVYQKDHPNFKLNVIETPWDDVQTKVTTAATSGDLSTLPDIFLMQDNAFQKNVISFPDVCADLTNSGIDFSQFAAGSYTHLTLPTTPYV